MFRLSGASLSPFIIYLSIHSCRSTGVVAVALLVGGFWLNNGRIIWKSTFVFYSNYYLDLFDNCGTFEDQYNCLRIH